MTTPARTFRLSLWLGALILVAAGLVAWLLVERGADDDRPAGASSSAPSDLEVVGPAAVRDALAAGATPIDVRTPTEFAAGHLRGAQNIDVNADGFAPQVSTLDPRAAYVVYCATGRRAAKAITEMKRAGFTELVNGGGYDDLAEAGLATEREDAVR